MKAKIKQNFKSVIHKLIEDSAKQQIPFTVPAGTRIQVYLTKDIMLRVNESLNAEMLGKANTYNKSTSNSSFTPTISNDVPKEENNNFGTGSTSAEINEPEDAGDDAGDEEPEGAEEEE